MKNECQYYQLLANKLYELSQGCTCNIQEILNTIKRFNSSKVYLSNNFICFEGERCSGKDTLISIASKYYNTTDSVIKKRVVDNKSWRILNNLKKDCYFYIDDPIKSCLLWFSDLAFRMYDWRINDNICFVNRYYYSVKSCIYSNYNFLNNNQFNQLELLLENMVGLFPKPKLVIVLDISIDTELKRLKEQRNRILSNTELITAKLNIEQFHNLVGDNIFHIDANRSLRDVFKLFIDIIEKNDIIIKG